MEEFRAMNLKVSSDFSLVKTQQETFLKSDFVQLILKVKKKL